MPRLCSKCGTNTSGFFKNARAPDGLMSVCKACHKAYSDQKRAYFEKLRALRAAQPRACTRCGSTTNGFYTDKRAWDGLKSNCKKCHHEYANRWKAKNPERAREICAKSRSNTPLEVLRERRNRWRNTGDNRKRLYAARKRWLEAHPERVAEFLEQLKLARANWKRNNPDAVKAHTHLRRARAKAAEGRFTATDVKRIFDEQHGQCCACGAGFDIVGYHIDHVVPLSKGGSNYPENIQLLCPTCNTRKATMDFTTFLNRIGKEQHHA